MCIRDRYIATRDGVDKIDDTQKFAPATTKQKNLIAKIVRKGDKMKRVYCLYRVSTKGLSLIHI